MALWWCEHAWLPPGEVVDGVVLEVQGDRFESVTGGVTTPPAGAHRLAGLTVPGLANAHSHAFHRALRGRAEQGRGTFWSWREQMYAVAERLTPDSYRHLARAVFAEMALAGVTCVGEFHYLHHDAGGVSYADPNAMGEAVVEAAAEAGVRITLLDTCYLTGGIDTPLDGPQRRFSDGDAHGWAQRVDALPRYGHARIGAAVHSVRAVPRDQIDVVAGWAERAGTPLHVHLSEQRAENDACMAAYGCTPTELLADAGALTDRTTAVHATHVTEPDISLLGRADVGTCLCPTTERDLADGIGPAARLAEAGSALSLGSDSHAVVDLFEEARAVELDERLASSERGRFTAAALLEAATSAGHAALGWPEAGRLSAGAVADLVTVKLDSVRTAGSGPTAETVVYAASAADVTDVLVGGRPVVQEGRHSLVHAVGRSLVRAVDRALG